MASALLNALLPAVGPLLGGIFSRRQSEETPIQGRQREVIDQILSSIQGEGPFSDLFNMNEDAFQKSFVEPAKRQFQTQIAPQIQQSYIASGQQRGTGIEDALTRAGVNLDDMLNQYRFQQMQQGQERQLGALERILGQGPGAAPEQTFGQVFQPALGGYFASPAFNEGISSILDRFGRNKPKQMQRQGFES